MTNIFRGFIAVLFLSICVNSSLVAQEDFRKMAPKSGPAPEIQLGDFQDFTLDNGLQVVLVENHKLPRVSYQLYIDVPEHLEGEYAGASGLMGDMLRRATSTMSKEEIDEAFDFIGASLSTSGSGAYASTITKYKDQVIDLMADVILDAKFTEEDFAKVKDDALAGIKAQMANPDAVADRVRRVLTYGENHPYGELNTEESINNVTLDVVQDYYDSYFAPNRSYLVMVGDLTIEEARMMAEEHFSSWEKKMVPEQQFPQPSAPEGVTVNFVPRTGAVQSNIIITSPIELQPGTKEAIRANLFNSILGSGFEGRLFKNLREDKAFTYGAYSSVNDDDLVGSFTARSNVRSEVTDSAVTEFMYELKKIASEPVSEDELARAKATQFGSFGRALESPQRIASYALNTLRYDLDRDFYPDYLKKVESASANDLREVAEDLVRPNNLHIVVVGDKAVAEKLAGFSTTGKVNYFDENGKMVDMDAMAAPSDVTPEQVISDYVNAIGGMDALKQVRNYSIMMEASIQGQTIQQSMIKDGGTKLSSQTTMMGQVMSDQRYNDGKARMMQAGQAMPDNPEVTKALAAQAALFPVADLANRIEMVSVDGTEMVDGAQTIVLKVDNGDAPASQYYFDMETKLMKRQVQQQGPATVTIDYSDYREVEGIMYPYMTSISGMMPMPLEMKTTDIKVNSDIDQGLFEIE